MTHEELYQQLLDKMKKYHPSEDFSIIHDVYKFSVNAHGKQLRKSGEPYIIHPMSVALILADIHSDIETIAAGILHDVMEDTEHGYDEIKNLFGEEIAEMVKGVTKLKSLKYVSKEEEQAENFRQLFFSMSNDIRVILIKMADRLHNLRTMAHMPREHQIKKAQETLDIYAPLAHRLGISKIRYQLEDYSFRYLMPEEYFDLVGKMKQRLAVRQRFISEIVHKIHLRLEKEGIEGKVVGRSKHLFSIYKKMISQNKSLDEIFDILAVRVIVDTKEDCYAVLGFVHEMYKPIPGRFKDYIAMPKSNNYRSLHTTALSGGNPFEVQIRTWDMDKVAEYGIAAHWKYKQRKGGIVDTQSEEAKFAWLRQIIEWQLDMSDNKEYLNALKDDLDIYKDHVYCFTPQGDVFNLLNGSTPIDFAYNIHSAVGNKMVGARVNGSIVTFDYVLKNGDQVEIITSNNSRGPSRDWLKIAKTGQARNKINQWFKKENKEENKVKGKALLEKEAIKKRADIYELISDKNRVNMVLSRYGFADWDSLCAAIGHGGLKEGQIVNRLLEEKEKAAQANKTPEIPVVKNVEEIDLNKRKKSGILVQGISDVSVRLSKCCRPVPGDEIVAFVTRGRGVTIHRTDCGNVMSLSEDDRIRLIEAMWGLPDEGDEHHSYLAEIRVLCLDRSNMIIDISKVLADDKNLKVMNFSARSVKNESVIDITLQISGKSQLEDISKKINSIQGVYEVNRINS